MGSFEDSSTSKSMLESCQPCSYSMSELNFVAQFGVAYSLGSIDLGAKSQNLQRSM